MVIEYNHNLKIHPKYFKDIREGRKRFEIRDAKDRHFKVGDRILLEEYIPSSSTGGKYTGCAEDIEITYVTTYQQQKGYVVFGFELMPF